MPVRLVRDTPIPLQDLIYDLDALTRQAKELDERRKVLQTMVTDRLKAQQEKSIRVVDPLDAEGDLKVVYIANRRVSVDSAKVKAAMGREFSKVRSDEVDREKLDTYLAGATEQVKAEVAQGISITEHPTVRLYHVAREASGGTD